MMLELNERELPRLIRSWLDEDIGIVGDITSMVTIPATHRSKGIIHMKQDGIVAGLPVAKLVFETIDPGLAFAAKAEEGSYVAKGTIVAEVSGLSRSILVGERLALNLLQRLSGIATRTRQYVDALEGFPTRLSDTRKTTPGHRMLDKYAVRVGGGHNNRYGLFDAVMIKDNHIKASGGVTAAIQAARRSIPHTMKIEVEVERFDQLDEAIAAGADIIMLDNMTVDAMRDAVIQIKNASPHIVIEASGGISLETVKSVAATGVDVITIGRITYSVEALDISLDLNEQKEGAR
jgi:nicotinate-nucleotide pyrophosphorylase (carboxylating)